MQYQSINLITRAPIIALLFVAACGGNEGEVADTIDAGPTSDATVRTIDLIGTWNASSYIITNNANSEESVDLIADGGETRMVVLAGGRARTFRTFNEVADDYDAQLLIIDDVLRATSAETPPRIWNWTFVLAGDTLTLEDASQNFDFGAGEVSATESVVFVLDQTP